MKLQTTIPLERRSEQLLDYDARVVLIGSCFVEHIGEKLAYYKFQAFQNPFGIVFHPKAVETIVARSFSKIPYTEEAVFKHNGLWHCFDAHSKWSSASKSDLLHNLNQQVHKTAEHLRNATHVILTLGTAWVYRYIKTNALVANCHKVPQKEFKKELLSIASVVHSLRYTTDLIKAMNPNSAVILTVSPVRHLKDGFVENTRSKAHLIAAIHELLSSQPESKGFYYFPSYEIMLDELRDYRFYKEDLVHPNNTAIAYIWDKFKTVWMEEDTLKTMTDIDAIQKGLAHKPFHPDSEAHRKFLRKLEQKKMTLKQRYPHLSF